MALQLYSNGARVDLERSQNGVTLIREYDRTPGLASELVGAMDNNGFGVME
jgi:hypothetical protein